MDQGGGARTVRAARSAPKGGRNESCTEIPGRPTVVLVHGAFADGSSWNGVIERLQAKGISVTAPANPLRGLSADSAYLAGVLDQTRGSRRPGRSLVRRGRDHATRRPTPRTSSASSSSPPSRRTRARSSVRSRRRRRTASSCRRSSRTPTRPATAQPASSSSSIRRSSATRSRPTCRRDGRGHGGNAATGRRGGVLRSRHGACLEGPAIVGRRRDGRRGRRRRSRPARWRERAGATITEVDGSHVVMVSQPEAVTEVILACVEATSAVAVG